MTAPDVDAMLAEEGPAAVQAELERLRRLVEGQAKELRHAVAQWGEQERRAEAAEAEVVAVRTKVRDLHRYYTHPRGRRYCEQCDYLADRRYTVSWPCSTIRAMDATIRALDGDS